MLWLGHPRYPNTDDMDKGRSARIDPLPEFLCIEVFAHAGSQILNAGRDLHLAP